MGYSKLIADVTEGFSMYTSLFVGSTTKRTLIQWLKVFKIIDTEIKNESEYLNYDYMTPCISQVFDILENLKLVLCVNNTDENEIFYIGRPIENVKEEISSDISLWKDYNITDIDIFSGIYTPYSEVGVVSWELEW